MMGCGASSNIQVSPIESETRLNYQKDQTNEKHSINNYQHEENVRRLDRFTFGICFPCYFLGTGNHSSSLKNEHLIYKQNSVEIQTENDIVGFKCQHTQTDLINMSEQEFNAMIKELDNEYSIENLKSQDNNKISSINETDSDEELFKGVKIWQNATNETRMPEQNNVAVQATRKKSTSATQTKFGSIDHNFILQNKLVVLKENFSNVIDHANTMSDPSMAKLLLSSLDEDDDGIDDRINTKNFNQLNEKQSLIQKEIYSQTNAEKQQKMQDCLFLLLKDICSKKSINQLLPGTEKRDVSLQTINDILTDEEPMYAARSPLCNKLEIIPSILMFETIDQKMLEATYIESTQDLANYICKYSKNDLYKVRALFIWITNNIKFNFKATGLEKNSAEILQLREGDSKDYCRLFGDVCRLLDIRVKKIDGFVRNYDYRPGYHFQPGKDALHSWNAVFVLSSWRFIDLTLAAGYTDVTGEFHTKINEYYFLTDPSVIIWTHFPFSNIEDNYDRWQLLDKPLSLKEFNALPKVSEYFFQYNLSIRSKIENPLEFRISTEIKIGSHEAMRYKYKLYPLDETENSSLNYYVFCQLKEDRLVGSFMVQPPMEGRYILKIFAKPEREMHGSQQDLSIALNPIVTMLIECNKARKYIEPFPLNDLPWGLTQKFYDYKLKLGNQKGPIIVTWGGRRRLVLEANETMLITYSLYDSDSLEMDTKNIISREDNGFKTIFTINPPRVGTFKFILFGMPKPKQKGKWRLPLLATLMIDCKMIKPAQHDLDMIAMENGMDKNDKKLKGNKKK